jgi:hypothetical protein
VSLSDYAGRWVVLISYPLDFTFVCPTELIAFSDRLPEFKALGADVHKVYSISRVPMLRTPREWAALTTGGFGGFDAWLGDARSGVLQIDTPLVKCRINIADIGRDDLVFEAGGIGRRIRVFRLPDENRHKELMLSRRIRLNQGVDNALYVCITQEDGHLIWSSPIYVTR